MMGESLVGKKEIVAYVRRSWMTIRRWILEDNFPARKIDGVWESDAVLVDDWKRSKIKPSGVSNESEEQPEPGKAM
jgi:hypothetical protein